MRFRVSKERLLSRVGEGFLEWKRKEKRRGEGEGETRGWSSAEGLTLSSHFVDRERAL